jgi:hypothetical protein
MFLVLNIDQMYKEMMKIQSQNGDEFPDFTDFFFFFGIKNVRVGRSETHIFFFWPCALLFISSPVS